MTFPVEYTRRAFRDLDEQYEWWSRHGRTAAERWQARFHQKVLAELESDPHRFPEADESADLGIDLRVMLFGRKPQVYRVLFTVTKGVVVVHRVRHAAQDRLSPGDI